MVSSDRDWRRINGLQLESIGCFGELSHHWLRKLLPNLPFHVMTTLTVRGVIGCNNYIYLLYKVLYFLHFLKNITETKVKLLNYKQIGNFHDMIIDCYFTKSNIYKMNPLVMSLDDMNRPNFCLSIWCCNGKTIHKISLQLLIWG